MDPRLQEAAESGSIEKLYALIDEDPYILDKIDASPFVNTPLHIAAASGNLPFAMEMLNLKPSFATKLNTSGYSPLHLAVEKGQRDFVYWLHFLNPSLCRIKGKEGITPFLLLVLRGYVHLVTVCLKTSPECIKDVSVNGENALHLAVINDRVEVLQLLTGWIQKTSQRDADSLERSVLNRVDFKHNTPLHIAASKNNQQAVKLLLQCREVRRYRVNSEGLTFFEILRSQGQKTGEDLRNQGQITGEDLRNQGQRTGEDLRNQGHKTGGESDLEQTVRETECKKEATAVSKTKETSDSLKSPITFWPNFLTATTRIRSQTSEEARGVFLIICTLLITSTYQTGLQPPGGVHQSGGPNAGTVVMNLVFFIFLWFSNTLGFCCALFYTFCLLPLNDLFATWFFWIGVTLCVSYAVAMAVISPYPLIFLFVTFAFFLLFLLYLTNEFFSYWRKYKKIDRSYN